jgi:hypothetical protein
MQAALRGTGRSEAVSAPFPSLASWLASLRRRLQASEHLRRRVGLFDSALVTRCDCWLVKRQCSASIESHSQEYIQVALDGAVRSRWLDAIWQDHNLLQLSYLAVDNERHLQGTIDAVVRLDGKQLACLFRHVSARRFLALGTGGPYRRHVYEMVCDLHLSDCDRGLLVYAHGRQNRVFCVRRSEPVFAAVVAKCRRLQHFVLNGIVPPCRCERSTNEQISLDRVRSEHYGAALSAQLDP